jgi:phospholipid/cholesterol/gamma-HCH transport system substrate-binding protein
MMLSSFVRVQLIIFSIVTVISLVVMGAYYMRIPSLVGIGRYEVTVQLPTSGGLYKTSNITYRGADVGTVLDVVPTQQGATATLSMNSSVKIPADVTAEVHSRSAIGEQYIDMVPTALDGPYLHDGSLIPAAQTTVPQDIAPMLDTANKNLAAIAPGKLSTLIDESYKAFNGTGPDLQRLLDSANLLVHDAHANVAPTTRLIDDMGPFLSAQAQSSDDIYTWARNLNSLTAQARERDDSIRAILQKGPGAADEATKLFQQLKPTLPLLLGNLTSLGQVAATYNPSLEQTLVILPQLMSMLNTIGVPNDVHNGGAGGPVLSFNLGNLNAPENCTTGYLPASERRDASAVDAPPRTTDPMYCAIPQNAPLDVRGARNLPCMEHPGKRAPTVAICNSDEEYQPKGTNPWIGDPLPVVGNPLGDQVPGNGGPAQPAPGAGGGTQAAPASYGTAVTPGAPPPVATATYDAKTGRYQGHDGATYELSSVATPSSNEVRTWQTMLTGRSA